MKELRTQIDIDAPPERVWALLTNFDSFPEWNPFIREASGDLQQGGRLKVRLGPSGGRVMTFRPTVVHYEPNRELRWLGRTGPPGVFDGEHCFTIEPQGSGVRFTQSELFHGALVPVLWRSLDKDTRRGFEEMNAALKARAELGS